MRGEQQQTIGQLNFSRHARQRLDQRQLKFSDKELERLEMAVQNLHNKGAKQSLVLLEKLALLVSVTNHRVITVVGREQLQQNVFTNIDSAVIA